MILNVSGRTDIIAFYSDWFMKRYEEGFVDVRNPFYEKNISRIKFEDVDAIVFCTKNPIPILERIEKITIPIIFHITLTPYKKDIEPYVPNKSLVIDAIKRLSNILGKDRIYVRYDPIFLSNKYNIDYHIKAFKKMCNLLDGYTNSIIVSFIDDYKNVRNNMDTLKLNNFTEKDYELIGKNFAKIASEHNMSVQTCSEENRLIKYGFINRDCVTRELVKNVTGKDYTKKWRARNNKNCSCVEMVDVGVYNSCKHYCKYCYANYNERKVKENFLKHDVNSSLLVGRIEEDDIIKIRKSKE